MPPGSAAGHAPPARSPAARRSTASSYFDEQHRPRRTSQPTSPHQQQPHASHSGTSTPLDEVAAAYLLAQQLHRHQQQQQQQHFLLQAQQRLYASAPSSPGLQPLSRPPTRPSSRAATRSRSGSNASASASSSSHQSFASSSYFQQPSPTHALNGISHHSLFPLTPLTGQIRASQTPPPLLIPQHDDLPPSYSVAVSNGGAGPPAGNSGTGTGASTPVRATNELSPSSGTSTPLLFSASRRGSLATSQSARERAGGDAHAVDALGRAQSSSSQQQHNSRHSRQASSSARSHIGGGGGSRPGSSSGNPQRLSMSGLTFTPTSQASSVSHGPISRSRLQSQSEIDLPRQQYLLQHGQRASTSSLHAIPPMLPLSPQGSMPGMDQSIADERHGLRSGPGSHRQERQQEEQELRQRARASQTEASQHSRRQTQQPRPRPSPTTRSNGGTASSAVAIAGRRRRVGGAGSADGSAPSSTRARLARSLRHILFHPSLIIHFLLRALLRILLAPIWLFTSVPHSSQAVVDAQPWGIRVLLFPLRLFAAVPGCVGTFWLLRNMWVGVCGDNGEWAVSQVADVVRWTGLVSGERLSRFRGRVCGGSTGGGGLGRKDHPTAIVFAVASLWSLSTAYYALSLTTLLLRRWLLYYSPLSSIIRLVALQAICWPLVRITLFVFGPTRPLEAWILIATTTTFSDTVARWLVSNIVDRVDGLGAWVVGDESEGEPIGPRGLGLREERSVSGEDGLASLDGGIGNVIIEDEEQRLRRQSRRRRKRRRRKREAERRLNGDLTNDDNTTTPTLQSRSRMLRQRSSYPERMRQQTAAGPGEIFKDTSTEDDAETSSGEDAGRAEARLQRDRARHRSTATDRNGVPRRRRRSAAGDRLLQSGADDLSYPRRTASYPRLPTSDILLLHPLESMVNPDRATLTEAAAASSAAAATTGDGAYPFEADGALESSISSISLLSGDSGGGSESDEEESDDEGSVNDDESCSDSEEDNDGRPAAHHHHRRRRTRTPNTTTRRSGRRRDENREDDDDDEDSLLGYDEHLPVRRVFHWDVAIKRNILPMGVLAYVSLWVLLGSSRVEGRGR
ncbi:hypothetical protein V8E36_003324 [Tilletia maclaganii]